MDYTQATAMIQIVDGQLINDIIFKWLCENFEVNTSVVVVDVGLKPMGPEKPSTLIIYIKGDSDKLADQLKSLSGIELVGLK